MTVIPTMQNKAGKKTPGIMYGNLSITSQKIHGKLGVLPQNIRILSVHVLEALRLGDVLVKMLPGGIPPNQSERSYSTGYKRP